MTRACSKCEREQELETGFYKHKTGYQWICKSCSREYAREWVKNKTQELGYPPYRHKNREYQLRHHYGLTPEEVPDACQVCGSDKRICVDHDHETGKVRGFLCDRCNVTLGKCDDDPNLLRQLADYLEK